MSRQAELSAPINLALPTNAIDIAAAVDAVKNVIVRARVH
jgi:hypothetical protein